MMATAVVPPFATPHLRQVMALLLDPQLLASNGFGRYPPEAVATARRLLAEFPGSSVGSYTHTGGHLHVRQAVAEFFTRRDAGLVSQVDDCLVNCGSVEAIKLLLEGFGRRRSPNKPTGALLPAPGCRLYEMLTRQVGVTPTPYRLGGPELGWQLVEAELEAAYQAAIDSGSEPRLLVLINPGSPAGQLLTPASLRLAAQFARRRRLFVIADETLQLGVFDADQFVGFRRVALEELPPLEVASLGSLSKPGFGEAGLRAGFCELLNLHPTVKATLVAVLACSSCPPVVGQAALVAALSSDYCGAEKSYQASAASMRVRAALVAATFQTGGPLELFEPPRAGIHAYVRVRLPSGINYANDVDVEFCLELRDRTGLAAQPGTAFGQLPPSAPQSHDCFFVRIGIQKSEADLAADLKLLAEFYRDFFSR